MKSPNAFGGDILSPESLLLSPALKKMKVHPAICMKTRDDDKMSSGGQVSILARCKGEAGHQRAAPDSNSWHLNPLPSHQPFHRFAFADQFRFGSVDQNFGGAQAHSALKFQCQKDRAGNRVKHVRLDWFEAQQRV